MSGPNQPLAEALAGLHAIVDGDDIGPAAVLNEFREPSGHLLAGVAGLRAQVTALEIERDRLRDIIRSTLTHVDDLTRRCGYPYCRFEISLFNEPKPHCDHCVAHEPWFSGEPEAADEAARAGEAS